MTVIKFVPLAERLSKLLLPLANIEAAPDIFVRLASSILDKHGFSHTVFAGRLTHGETVIAPHYWIVIRDHIIDFHGSRQLMIDNGGIFKANDNLNYYGIKVNFIPFTPTIFNVLTNLNLANC